MTLMEMFNICDNCVYARCLCGNDPENCVMYVERNSVDASGGAHDAAD
mgnify:CR=1 FL=1